jgi:hypothetical protein
LVDQILFDSTVASQQIRHEQLRKVSLIMKCSDHRRFGDAGDQAFIHRRRCCDAQPVAIQASFAKKMAGSQDGDYGFLALLGNHRKLELAFLDVENRIRDFALRENDLILLIFGYRFSLADLGEEFLGIKGPALLRHNAPPSPGDGVTNRGNYTAVNDRNKGLRQFVGACRLPAPAPAPAATETVAAANKPHDEKEDQRADGRVDDRGHNTDARVDVEWWQQPLADKGSYDPDHEIADDPNPVPRTI